MAGRFDDFWVLLGSRGSLFGSILVPWPPLGPSLVPQSEKGEKSDISERKRQPFWSPKWSPNGARMVKNEAEIDIDFGIDFFMIFCRFGSISGSIWESFWSYFWYFFGPGGRSEQKSRFSRKAMNSVCFFDILRVRGVQNLIIFAPAGDFFDVRKSSRIFHRFLRPKVRI